MKRTISKLLRLTFGILLTVQVTSCGLLDFGLDEDAVTALKMRLNYDTIYVMRGDTFSVSPMFQPDSVSLKDLYIYSDADSVVSVRANRVEAIGVGWATIFAESLSARLLDSCHVYVMERWDSIMVEDYPHETVVYADVTIHGKPFTDDDVVGAFVKGELRAVGKVVLAQNQRFMLFRIPGDVVADDEKESIPVGFICYNSKTHFYQTFPQWIYFDGETHGLPSKRIQLSLE